MTDNIILTGTDNTDIIQSDTNVPSSVGSHISVLARIANQSPILSPNNTPGVLLTQHMDTITKTGEDIYNKKDMISPNDVIITSFFAHHPNQFTLNQTKHNLENVAGLYAIEQKNAGVLWNMITKDPTEIIKDFVAMLSVHFVAESISNKTLFASPIPSHTTQHQKTKLSTSTSDYDEKIILKEESLDNYIRPIQIQDDLDGMDVVTSQTNNKDIKQENLAVTTTIDSDITPKKHTRKKKSVPKKNDKSEITSDK